MDTAFGTKIYNRENNSIGLLIKNWQNEFADGKFSWIIRGVGGVTSDRHLTGWVRFRSHGALPKIRFATYVNTDGKRYHIELDKIAPLKSVEE